MCKQRSKVSHLFLMWQPFFIRMNCFNVFIIYDSVFLVKFVSGWIINTNTCSHEELSQWFQLGFRYNPYLLIYVCYPCICKYVRIKICLNQWFQRCPSPVVVFLIVIVILVSRVIVCHRCEVSPLLILVKGNLWTSDMTLFSSKKKRLSGQSKSNRLYCEIVTQGKMNCTILYVDCVIVVCFITLWQWWSRWPWLSVYIPDVPCGDFFFSIPMRVCFLVKVHRFDWHLKVDS